MFFWELHTGDFPIKIWYDFSLDDFGRRLLKIYCDVSPILQNIFSKVFVQNHPMSETPLKPHGFRPLWNPSETTRFQTPLKPLWNHTVSDHSETLLKPHGFRPLWNPSETTRFQTTLKPLWNPSETITGRSGMALERPYIEKQVVGTDLRQFQAAVWFKTNYTAGFGSLLLKKRWVWDLSETTLKPSGGFQTGFRLVWNHLFSLRDRVWRRPYVAKQVVSTDSGTPKSQKTPQFLTLDSRIPAEGCFEHEKIAKNPQFLTFFGDFRLFLLSRKNGRM